MDEKEFKKALDKLKADSPKRNFNQAYDLVINLKQMNMKKPENHVDIFLTLKYSKGKATKICAFVGPELKDAAKEACDFVVTGTEFSKYKDSKKDLKKLAKTYDFFIAQANLMPEIAKIFGRVLGTRGKMPNPKAGCVVPPNANLKVLVERLKKTVRLFAKTQLSIKSMVGKQDMPDEEVLHNMISIYNTVIHKLPAEENNIKNVMLKVTMGPPVLIGEKKSKEGAK